MIRRILYLCKLKSTSLMKLLEFASEHPDEASCITDLGELKERNPHVRPECGYACRFRKKDKTFHCGESPRKGTVRENSRLPFRYLSVPMHFLTVAKNTFSAMVPRHQSGHKRCQSIREILHEFHGVTVGRDGRCALASNVEIDEGFFSAEVPGDKKDEGFERGAGNQSRTKVSVMDRSEEVENPKNPKSSRKPGKAGHVRMIVVSDLKSGTIPAVAGESVGAEAIVVSDDTKPHVKFPKMSKEYVGRVVSVGETGKVLSGSHVAIAETKTGLADICRGIKPEYLQEYSNEFLHKFNLCCFGERPFDRLPVVVADFSPSFRSRVYNSNIASA